MIFHNHPAIKGYPHGELETMHILIFKLINHDYIITINHHSSSWKTSKFLFHWLLLHFFHQRVVRNVGCRRTRPRRLPWHSAPAPCHRSGRRPRARTGGPLLELSKIWGGTKNRWVYFRWFHEKSQSKNSKKWMTGGIWRAGNHHIPHQSWIYAGSHAKMLKKRMGVFLGIEIGLSKSWGLKWLMAGCPWNCLFPGGNAFSNMTIGAPYFQTNLYQILSQNGRYTRPTWRFKDHIRP